MRTMTRNVMRGIWITIGLLIVALTAWLIIGTGPRVSETAEHRAGPDMMQGTPGLTKPMGASEDVGPAQAFAMVTPFKQQLIGLKTALVEKRPMETVVRAVGRASYDEQRIGYVNLRVSGWIEDLFVDYSGQMVRKGQPLFTLYSPDLVATQDEYLLALRAREKVKESPLPEVRQQADQVVEAARDRLKLWTLTDQQVTGLAKRGKAQTYVTIYSPVRGYVIDKKVFKGMFVQPEITLYTVADLSTIWINADIYEYEVPFVEKGQSATVTFAAYPGEQFHGRISYIYPYLNREARTVKVRIDLPNPDTRIMPEMYGDVLLTVNRGSKVAVPEEAVLDSGTRTLIFVVRGEGLFEPRAVKLGPKIGSYYEVREGIAEGDRVVTSGNFLIDSESKLMAATNMMGSLGMGGIRMEQAQMGQMDMGDMKQEQGMPTSTKERKGRQEKTVEGIGIVMTTEPSPARVGENRIRVQVNTGTRKDVPSSVSLTYTMPMPGMMPATVAMKPSTEPDGFEATVNLGMAGQWDLTVTVSRPDRPVAKATFSVRAGGM